MFFTLLLVWHFSTIVYLFFSVRKHFWAEILIFGKVWSKVVEDEEIECGVQCSKLCTYFSQLGISFDPRHWFLTEFDQSFSGMRKSNPVSNVRNCVLTFAQLGISFLRRHWFLTKFDRRFSGIRKSNLVSNARNCVLTFLSKKASIAWAIDSSQSFTKGFPGWGNRIRCQMFEIGHIVFSLRKHFWPEI